MNDYELGLNAYQTTVLQFRTDTANAEYALLGLSAEVGELHGLLAKSIRDGEKEGHKTLLIKELGDILWFVAAIAADNGVSLEDVATVNIRKLSSRYERGVISGSGDNR